MSSGLELAISPSQRTPGLGLLVDFLATPQSPGSAPLNALIICPAATNGTITPDTQLVQAVSGAAQVGTLLGQGTPGHLAATALFAELPTAQVDLVAPLASVGSTAVGTFSFSVASGPGPGPVTQAWTVTVTVAGRQVQFQWLPTDGTAGGATKMVNALLAIDAQSPVTPSNGGGLSATCTLTSKLPGQIGNDVTFSVTMVGGAGGSITPSGSQLSGGALEPSIGNVLNLIGNQEYTYILLCTSNADADSASASSNVQVLQNYVGANDSGTSAKLQQIIVGVTGTLTGAMAGTAKHDCGFMEYVFCNAGQSLPCEWGGAECGARLREVALYAVKNRINMLYKAVLYGPSSLASQALTPVQVETALLSGVTPVTFDAVGNPRPSRPITTYFISTTGAPDDRILDVTRVDGLYTVARDLRTALPEQFPGKSITEDLPDGADSLPADVVEIRDVRSFVCTRLNTWATAGVLDPTELAIAIGTPQSPGTLIVQIDPDDADQVDMVLPLSTIRPLAKFSCVVQQAA